MKREALPMEAIELNVLRRDFHVPSLTEPWDLQVVEAIEKAHADLVARLKASMVATLATSKELGWTRGHVR